MKFFRYLISMMLLALNLSIGAADGSKASTPENGKKLRQESTTDPVDFDALFVKPREPKDETPQSAEQNGQQNVAPLTVPKGVQHVQASKNRQELLAKWGITLRRDDHFPEFYYSLDDVCDELFQAARDGDAKKLAEALNEAGDFDDFDIDSGLPEPKNGEKYCDSALIVAARNGHKDVVELLLNNGANPWFKNGKNQDEESAWDVANQEIRLSILVKHSPHFLRIFPALKED